MNNNNYPQQASTAKDRFEQKCQNLRFYRDDYDTICKGNETVIGRRIAPHKPNNQVVLDLPKAVNADPAITTATPIYAHWFK
jgi:hypothetical protein